MWNSLVLTLGKESGEIASKMAVNRAGGIKKIEMYAN
jgi:hypothetical protein